MRDLQLVEFVTLDGVMQGFGSADEDRDGGFTHGGWGAAYTDEVQMQQAGKAISATTAYLFGRRTYEKMAAFWPHQPQDNPMAAHLNDTDKYVATRTLTDLSWDRASVLEGDLVSAVESLKATGEGSIVVLGSGVLARQLIAEGLVDGYRLFLHPLLLGSGKRLFGGIDEPRPLQLTSCVQTSTGVLILSYTNASGTAPRR